MPTATASGALKWDMLVTKRQGLTRDLPPGKEQWTWVPTSATLIFGQRDAVLVDDFLTAEQAATLVEWVAASGKNLTTIYVTAAMVTIVLASERSRIVFPTRERWLRPMW